MQLREAVESDASWMAELTGGPTDAARRLVHDRTVTVATDGEDPRGFLAYDADRETVHITQIQGTEAACTRLLDEPLAFADREGMPVELLLAETDDLRRIVEEKGFENHGAGPRFDDTRTIRYRLD